MPKKKRRYNTRLIRREYSYTIQEIAEVYSLHKNAVSRWLKSGLKPIDLTRPILIHGSDIITYLDEKQGQRRAKCRDNEFYCFKCRTPSNPVGNLVDILPRNEKQLTLRALCSTCGTQMLKAGSVRKTEFYCQVFDTATPALAHINETPLPRVKCDLEGNSKNG